MLNADTKRHIDAARDVLVGVAPNPMTQVDQITYALIYKFMDDMDQSAIKLGGEPSFFVGDLEPYAYSKLMDSRLGNQERMNLYGEALTKFAEAKQLPELFRTIFRAAFLPYRSPETLGLFLKEINFFDYSHPEELGNAYEYLLSIMSAQGDAGQFRTPRHIIDFMVDVLDPTKTDKVLDPACGTGGFLISSYNHILEKHDGDNDPAGQEQPLTPDERRKLMENFEGYDIDPSMVRIAQVNMYLHLFKNPKIYQYDSLTSEERWNDKFDVILANPPFMSPKGGIKPHSKYGIQSTRSEVLFVDYITSHLKPAGRAAIIVPEGIIFQSGKAYKELRRSLVESGLYAVASLPTGVFQPYSGVKTSILFLDNSIAKIREELLFLKISNDGFDLGASKRPIDKNDLPEALRVLEAWKAGGEATGEISTLIPKSTILENPDFSLTAEKYVVNESFTSSSWDIKSLKELEEEGLLKLGRGQIISKIDLEDDPGIYPVYSSSASGSGEFGQYGKYMFDEELITWSVDGGGRLFHRPRHKFSVTNVSGWMKILDPTKLDYKYLYYVLIHQWSTLDFDYVAKAHPSVIRDIYKIPLPPLRMQQQIVSELDGYSAIVDAIQTIIENWKPQLVTSSEWKTMTLGEVADWSSGGTPKSGAADYYGGDIPWAVIGDLTEGLVVSTEKSLTELGLKESSAKVVPEGTVFLAMYGASIGRTGISGLPMATNQAIACGSCKRDIIEPWYLLYFLQSQKQAFVAAGTGGAQPNISQGIVKSWPIPVPPISEQHQILSKIHSDKSQVLGLLELQSSYQERINDAINILWQD